MNRSRVIKAVDPKVREDMAHYSIPTIGSTVQHAVDAVLRYLDSNGLIDVCFCDECGAMFVFDPEDDNRRGGDVETFRGLEAQPTECADCYRKRIPRALHANQAPSSHSPVTSGPAPGTATPEQEAEAVEEALDLYAIAERHRRLYVDKPRGRAATHARRVSQGDVPALIAEVRRLRYVNEGYVEDCDRWTEERAGFEEEIDRLRAATASLPAPAVEQGPHRIKIELRDDSLDITATCSATPGASCRRVCDKPEHQGDNCECDVSGEDGWRDNGECLAVEWMTSLDPLGDLHDQRQVVYSGPVEYEWRGEDGPVWRLPAPVLDRQLGLDFTAPAATAVDRRDLIAVLSLAEQANEAEGWSVADRAENAAQIGRVASASPVVVEADAVETDDDGAGPTLDVRDMITRLNERYGDPVLGYIAFDPAHLGAAKHFDGNVYPNLEEAADACSRGNEPRVFDIGSVNDYEVYALVAVASTAVSAEGGEAPAVTEVPGEPVYCGECYEGGIETLMIADDEGGHSCPIHDHRRPTLAVPVAPAVSAPPAVNQDGDR